LLLLLMLKTDAVVTLYATDVAVVIVVVVVDGDDEDDDALLQFQLQMLSMECSVLITSLVSSRNGQLVDETRNAEIQNVDNSLFLSLHS
jgi:hypothetical protein